MAAGCPGFVAVRRAEIKGRSDAAAAVDSAQHWFAAVSGEALGGWSSAGFDILQSIARRSACHLHESYPTVMNRLLQRLSVVINRGSAAVVINALNPTLRHTHSGVAEQLAL